ncbi:TOPRIM nucleotidyl transferase/hydrolase domain-containing protein [Sorangium sp. So ce295]|uniref:ATP-dependent nuclease n=1 Tax=Sorangium sp. So ce295 TaxID=3133295 RepID=UPI003F606A42
MTLAIDISVNLPNLFGGLPQNLMIVDGLTTFVGPNGSGKTQVLHVLRDELGRHSAGKNVRYLSPGRLATIEHARSDLDGHRGGRAEFNPTYIGQKQHLRRRHAASGIAGDVLALHERPDLRIKVEARLQALFRRRIDLEWTQAGLQVDFTRTDNGSSYYASQEASGLLHLVSILAAAFDDGVGALLLDEPEVSLHPQLQAYVLRELRGVAGDPALPGKKLVVISSHSPAMLQARRPEHLTSMVFFQDSTAPWRQIPAATPELRSKAIAGLLARMGESHRAAFFARLLLLVEGPSDEIIANALAARLELPLDASGTQIVPVIGKGEMGSVRKLFRLTGKICAVLADLDAFVDDGKLTGEFCDHPAIEQALQTRGHRDLRSFSTAVRDDLKKALAANYDDLGPAVERHPYWINREPQASPESARYRAGTATLLSMNDETIASLPNSSQWSSLRMRIVALLDALELGDCFILRRGALESYSLSTSASDIRGKPEAAVAEAERIETEPELRVRQEFGDIIRAIEYSAPRPRVDEAAQLRQILLAALAPCLDNTTKTTTNIELNQRVRNFVKDRAALLSVENLTTTGSARLRVSLNSTILDAQRFPIEVTRENLYAVLDAALPSRTSNVVTQVQQERTSNGCTGRTA